MGTRSKSPDRKFETNTEYGLEEATPELNALKDWKPDPTLFNAGTQAGFSQRTRDIKEGFGSPYSGITNPVTRARMTDLALQEAEGQRASALGDQDLQYQRMSYEPLAQAAALRQQDRVKKKEWGYGPEQQKQGGGLLGSAIGAAGNIFGGLAAGGLL